MWLCDGVLVDFLGTHGLPRGLARGVVMSSVSNREQVAADFAHFQGFVRETLRRRRPLRTPP